MTKCFIFKLSSLSIVKFIYQKSFLSSTLSALLCAIDTQFCDVSTHHKQKSLKTFITNRCMMRIPMWLEIIEQKEIKDVSSLSFCHCFLLCSPILLPSVVVVVIIVFFYFFVFCGRIERIFFSFLDACLIWWKKLLLGSNALWDFFSLLFFVLFWIHPRLLHSHLSFGFQTNWFLYFFDGVIPPRPLHLKVLIKRKSKINFMWSSVEEKTCSVMKLFFLESF